MGSPYEMLMEFKSNMLKAFKMTDLGKLKYFFSFDSKTIQGIPVCDPTEICR